MNSIKIREATSRDADAISSLMSELGYDLSPSGVEERIDIYLNSSDTVLVADDCGKVVGFLSFHVIPLFHTSSNLGRISAMCISSTQQRKGIGRAILGRLDDVARNKGCSRIEVTSGDRRAQDAHLFYQSCGYIIDCRRFQRILK